MARQPWHCRRSAALVAVLLLAFAAAASSTGAAQAEGDVSGEWHVVMTPAPPSVQHLARAVPWFEIDCILYISQDGAMLSSPVACGSASGAVFFTGAFDKATMHFSLQGGVANGVALNMGGTLSQDGATATGAWASFPPPSPAVMSGALSATRADGWWGDVDCSKAANSVDAVLVLQLMAGLPVSLSCQAYGDVNTDRTVSALDAVLILQREAGLLSRLPVVSPS